jgi:hypothetical protein
MTKTDQKTIISKTCKKHGILEEKDIRITIIKGWTCKQCRICNREYDVIKRQNPIYKQKRLENSRRPENRIKQKKLAISYKERRRVVALALYYKNKNNPEFKKKEKLWGSNSYKRGKETISDGYIKKLLRIHKDATPELIQEKRLQVIEFRKLKEDIKLQKKLLIEQNEKIKNYRIAHGIIKICKIHGELTTEECHFVKHGVKTMNKIYICRLCKNEKTKKYYYENIESSTKTKLLYRENNLELARKRSRDWHIELSDGYMRRLLIQNTNIKPEDITKDLIHLKKSLLMLKRNLRERSKLLKLPEVNNVND